MKTSDSERMYTKDIFKQLRDFGTLKLHLENFEIYKYFSNLLSKLLIYSQLLLMHLILLKLRNRQKFFQIPLIKPFTLQVILLDW